ncbi:MAG: GIY-YIG nuclease family protein [Candidatus Paceibacterota bacterium]
MPKNICHSCARFDSNRGEKAGIQLQNNVLYFSQSKEWDTIYRSTSDLIKRIYEHRNKLAPGFTAKYDVDKLVYFESTTDVYSAISREKQLKNWKRGWKLALIEKDNRDWNDLYNNLISGS